MTDSSMRSPRFDSVDQHDPAACIAFLDLAHSLDDVTRFKQRSHALLRLREGDRALDVGCGVGEDACSLVSHVGSRGAVVGVDSSIAMVNEAQRRASARGVNVTFEQADVYALPFASNTFHATRADRLLHVLDGPAAALEEMIRVTRPGGSVVVGEPDWSSLAIHGGDELVTDAILDYSRATHAPSRVIGARLAPLMENAGLDLDEVVTEPLMLSDMELCIALFDVIGLAYRTVAASRISAASARAWLRSLTDAAARGEFACSFVGYTVSGIKSKNPSGGKRQTVVPIQKTSGIDFSDPAFIDNPYPTYKAIREEGGVLWLPHGGNTGGMWLIAGYENVAAILKSRHTSKCARPATISQAAGPLERNLLAQDPPEHTRVRALVMRAFTPQRITMLAPSIEALANELIDKMIGREQADFVAEFAAVLPAFVIADLLGVPRRDREKFSEWSRAFLTGPDLSNPRTQQSGAAAAALAEYFQALVARRRSEPCDDLISSLVQSCDLDGEISENEVVATLILLLVAGHETTVNLLGNGLSLLLRHHEQYELLHATPGLVASMIEEVLRFESPVQRATFRVTSQPMVINGVAIDAGDQVSALIGSANRDPLQFECPDRLDITREPNRHLAFGAGIHACLGPALARLEAKITFESLLQRAPGIRLVNERPRWQGGTSAVRGLAALPVLFR
jgi:pimeloyl-[acyl-carrier protein] synthase